MSAGASPQEDLSSSWSPSLITNVPALQSTDCAQIDRDGDGFVSAQDCPGGEPSKLDCDDSDPAVTPETERWVRPGPFIMGSASDHAGFDEKPVHVVMLSGYCLDRTELTARDFSVWLKEAGRVPEGPDVDGVTTDGSLEAERAQLPIEGVTWQEAHDYCAAQGKALPTEAQWEKAARGGCERGDDPTQCDPGDLVPYPWGTDTPTCKLANHNLSTEGRPTLCTSDTIQAGAQGSNTGPYGHRDLAGNVWEYVADYYHPHVYKSEATRVDPGGPSEGSNHGLRGGSWNTFSTNMRVANRFSDMVMGSAAGIRCARPTVPAQADSMPPLEMITLSGTLRREGGLPFHGRALYVTVFDSADEDPVSGMLTPGRSPVAEARLVPSGETTQSFEIQVFKAQKGSYLLQASLDDESGNDKGDYLSASGSGGFGESYANPIMAGQSMSGLEVELKKPPEGGAGGPGSRAPSQGGGKGSPGGR